MVSTLKPLATRAPQFYQTFELHIFEFLPYIKTRQDKTKSTNMVNATLTLQSRTLLDKEQPILASFMCKLNTMSMMTCTEDLKRECLKCNSVVWSSALFSIWSNLFLFQSLKHQYPDSKHSACQNYCNLQWSGVTPNTICHNPLKEEKSTKQYFFILIND